MRIQHNIPSMNAYRNYNNNSGRLSNNLEKLSSGYRINRAGDDAAGLAISEKMRAQISGLEVAQKNAKDGISLVQTAEGALTEVQDMLNRMYSLAEQSANGTYDDTVDRAQLQKEVESLRNEIDRIGDSANFNGIKLLDGSLSVTATNGGVDLGDAEDYIDASAVTSSVNYAETTLPVVQDDVNKILKNTGLSFNVTVGINGSITATFNATTIGDYTFALAESGGSIEIKYGDGESDPVVLGTVAFSFPDTAAKNPTATVTATVTLRVGAEGNGAMILQVGDTPEKYDKLAVSVDSVKTERLGAYTVDTATAANGVEVEYKTTTGTTINQINISTQDGAAEALDVIKHAINYVSDTRGGLGAIQNRLDHTINNLSVMQENMQDAESTIRDTDVADEMMKYTKNNILVQSAQAMLAQANQIPQGVLQLLQ